MSFLELPRRAAIYCRISQDRSDERLGVERQETECRALADRNGWEVIRTFVDDNISAYSGKTRPQFELMLADIAADEIDLVVAWHPDRLYRGFTEFLRLSKLMKLHGATVHTVMAGEVDLSTAAGQMMAEIMTSFAQYESKQKADRIRSKHAQSARAGLAHGGPRPFGYERVQGKPGTLAIVESEAEVIREAANRVLAGESVRAISIDFTNRGIATVRGGRWQLKALSDILASPRIAGLRPAGGEGIAAATWDPILDRQTWERVHAMVTHGTVGRRPRTNVLSGFLWCGRCGQRMFGVAKTYRGKRRRQYECRRDGQGLGACAALSVEAGPLESYVSGLVFGAADGADLGHLRRSRRVGDQAALASRLEEDEQLLSDLAKDFGNRVISRPEWFAARVPVEERIDESRRGLARLAPNDLIPADLADVAGRWEALTFDQRRAVIALFIGKIFIDPATHKGGRFSPVRVRVEWAA
ncbi:MAG: recombinase family protein [Actinomycetia bacterium]|nr:recombinase family protein [Actinomycetes bacterium]